MINKNQTMNAVDAPLYGYWQALFMAFYSRRLYVDVAKRWHGFGLSYFLLLLAVAVFPLSLRIIMDFNHYFDEQLMAPIKKIPTVYVQNGRVSFDKPMPYVIKNNAGKVVGAIDTTTTIKKMTAQYPQLIFLLTSDTLYFRPPALVFFFMKSAPLMQQSFSADSFDGSDNEVFNGETWGGNNGMLRLKTILSILIYPCITLFLYGIFFTLMLAFALMGQVFSQAIFKFKLRFKQACRLIAIASTPNVILFFACISSNYIIPWMGFFNIALLAGYFSYAVISVKRESNQLVFA